MLTVCVDKVCGQSRVCGQEERKHDDLRFDMFSKRLAEDD